MAESVKIPLRMTAREFVTCLAVMAHSAKVALAFLVQPIQGEVVSVRSADSAFGFGRLELGLGQLGQSRKSAAFSHADGLADDRPLRQPSHRPHLRGRIATLCSWTCCTTTPAP